MILDIKPSPLKTKRFRATILTHNGQKKTIDFGQKDGVTYIDKTTNGAPLRTTQERNNYLKLHLANPTEKKLIENLVPSPSLLSAVLLWGKHRNLSKNTNELNKLFKEKYG